MQGKLVHESTVGAEPDEANPRSPRVAIDALCRDERPGPPSRSRAAAAARAGLRGPRRDPRAARILADRRGRARPGAGRARGLGGGPHGLLPADRLPVRQRRGGRPRRVPPPARDVRRGRRPAGQRPPPAPRVRAPAARRGARAQRRGHRPAVRGRLGRGLQRDGREPDPHLRHGRGAVGDLRGRAVGPLAPRRRSRPRRRPRDARGAARALRRPAGARPRARQRRHRRPAPGARRRHARRRRVGAGAARPAVRRPGHHRGLRRRGPGPLP